MKLEPPACIRRRPEGRSRRVGASAKAVWRRRAARLMKQYCDPRPDRGLRGADHVPSQGTLGNHSEREPLRPRRRDPAWNQHMRLARSTQLEVIRRGEGHDDHSPIVRSAEQLRCPSAHRPKRKARDRGIRVVDDLDHGSYGCMARVTRSGGQRISAIYGNEFLPQRARG